MTNNDLKQIGELIDEKLDKRLSVTETRLREEITASSKEVKEDIGDFIEHTLMPLLDERFDAIDERFNSIDERLEEKAGKTDIDRIERKLDKLLDTDLDHEYRIKNIEAVPVIAHQLKHRKPK